MIELNEDNILLKSTVYIATDAFESKITGSSKSEATTSELEVTGSKNVSLRSFGWQEVARVFNIPGKW